MSNNLWNEFLALGNPTEAELVDILTNSKSYKDDAGGMLLERNPSNSTLRKIIWNSKTLRVRAGKKLLAQNPSNEELNTIMCNAPELATITRRFLLKRRQCTGDQLLWVMEDPNLVERAWMRLLELGANNSTLINVAAEVPTLRKKIWETLLMKGMSTAEIQTILTQIPEWGEKAMEMLLKMGDKKTGLMWIIRNCKEFVQPAWEALKNEGGVTKDELEAILLFANDINAVRSDVWEQYFAHRFSKEELLNLLKRDRLSDKREQILERVLTLELTDSELLHIMRSSEALRSAAWRKICGRTTVVDKTILKLVIDEFPLYGEEAKRLMLCQKLENWELVLIIKSSETLRAAAWSELLKQSPDADQLCRVAEAGIPVVSLAAGEILLAREELISVMRTVPELREKAWKAFQKSPRTNDDYRRVADAVPTLRVEALRKVLLQNPTEVQLSWIANNVPELYEEAMKPLTKIRSRKELIKKMKNA